MTAHTVLAGGFVAGLLLGVVFSALSFLNQGR